MHKCFEEIQKKLNAQFAEKYGDKVTDVKDFRFDNQLLSLADGKMQLVMMVSGGIKYRRVRTNGEPAARQSTEKFNLKMKYCPFCGEKLE